MYAVFNRIKIGPQNKIQIFGLEATWPEDPMEKSLYHLTYHNQKLILARTKPAKSDYTLISHVNDQFEIHGNLLNYKEGKDKDTK